MAKAAGWGVMASHRSGETEGGRGGCMWGRGGGGCQVCLGLSCPALRAGRAWLVSCEQTGADRGRVGVWKPLDVSAACCRLPSAAHQQASTHTPNASAPLQTRSSLTWPWACPRGRSRRAPPAGGWRCRWGKGATRRSSPRCVLARWPQSSGGPPKPGREAWCPSTHAPARACASPHARPHPPKPPSSERLAKYNQLLRIEEELGDAAAYAGDEWRHIPIA
jgi:hypothetical protein